MLHLGTRKGLFTAEKSNGRWKIVRSSFLGVQVPMLLPDFRDGTLYAAVDHGHFGTKFHRSRDHGASWEEFPPPAYPPKPDDAPIVVDPMRQTEIPWSLEKIWSLEAGGEDEPGTLWCGTLPGGLFKSTDRGETWALNRPLWDEPKRARWFGGGYDVPGIHSIAVDPRDPQHILLAISCGGVWRTRDGGETWHQTAHGMKAGYMPGDLAADPEIQDGHRMVQCPADPERLWVQHHSGIFRSDDSGRSWQEILNVQPSNFGFAVAVHPHDPDTAWFVPAEKDECRIPKDAKFVVNRTRDGGKTFETFSNGLPPEPAYHLVYRHCLEIDPTGQTLAMGSTTGGLWTSDDGGESWQTLSQDLPPVFCVRFG